MSVINCKMCGGDIQISEDRTYGTCEYCGCTMTLPKMDGEQTAAAFNRGNQFRRMGEFDKALAVYERIVEQDDSNAEAHWCCALCRFGIEYVEDPETHEWIPTCHRASFDSILEDVDYLAALDHSDGVTRKQYERDGAKIARVQKAVLATSQQEEPFDVFLCYKESEDDGTRTKDSTLAQDIYYQLTDQGRRVFFARITLEDKGGAEYEPYIFAALHSAKVMVVVGTSAAHLNAVWVKNEWSRFLALMKQDRSRLLLPCYRDMDPYDLPEQLSILQSYDMSKIGFIQDLIRGISKVLDAGKEKETEQKAKETVILQGEGGNLEALLQRGDIALEDGEWKKADSFYEQALNLDADEPRAYLGKFLAEQNQPNLEKLAEARTALHTAEPAALEACPEDAGTIKRIVRENTLEGYYTPADDLFPFDRTYPANAAQWQELYAEEAAFWNGKKLYQRALEFSGGELREELEAAPDGLLKALKQKQEEAETAEAAERERICAAYREHLQKAEQEAARKLEEAKKKQEQDLLEKERQKQATYEEACRKQEAATATAELVTVQQMFTGLGKYRDSLARVRACADKIEALRKADLIEYERKQQQLRKKRKVRALIASACVLTAAVLTVLTVFVIIPNVKYSSAEKLLEAGDYDNAITAFSELDDFRDAPERIKEAEAAKLEEKNAEKYAQAESLEKTGDEQGALTAFRALGQYRDAPIRASKIEYAQADSLYKNKRYAQAFISFLALKDYEDSQKKAQQAWHDLELQAEAFIKQKEYVKAMALFQPIQANNEAKEKVQEIKYMQADSFAEEGNYEQALEEFKKLANYKDAPDRIKQIQYKQADALASEGKKLQAIEIFKALKGYDDSNERVDELTKSIGVRQTMAAGRNHTVILNADGTVTAEGSNQYGQCDVSKWKNIIAVAAGSYHTVGLSKDGWVYATGKNEEDECNVGAWSGIVAIAAGHERTVGLKSDGTVVETGYKITQVAQGDVKWWKNIVSVSDGGFHTVGLEDGGTAIAAGTRYNNKLGVDDWKDLTAIAAGWNHTLGLKTDGTVLAVGLGQNGSAAPGENVMGVVYDGQCDVSGWNEITSISAGAHHSVGLRADGTVVAVGDNKYGQCDVSNWTDVVEISTGYNCTLARKKDGTILMAGTIDVYIK